MRLSGKHFKRAIRTHAQEPGKGFFGRVKSAFTFLARPFRRKKIVRPAGYWHTPEGMATTGKSMDAMFRISKTPPLTPTTKIFSKTAVDQLLGRQAFVSMSPRKQMDELTTLMNRAGNDEVLAHIEQIRAKVAKKVMRRRSK